MGEITIVGLGPGSFGLMTLETLEVLERADKVLLRTAKHPTVAKLVERGLQFFSYDYVYEQCKTFEEVYLTITDHCLSQAKNHNVVYAVPGSPLVAERTVNLIREKAKKLDIAVKILPGMSFLEVLYTRLGVDPIEGLTIVDAMDIEQLPSSLATGLVVTQVYNRQVASETKLSLMEKLPDDYEVTLVKNLGLDNEEIAAVPLYELDRLEGIDHLTSLYVPPLAKRAASVSSVNMNPIVEVMAKLRSPEGCIWDLQQSHSSLRRYLVEEVYEVLEAIDLKDADKLCEELGDLLLQIVFHARIAEENQLFSLQEVVDAIADKMIYRHPHVFGDTQVDSSAQVLLNWEELKKQEKGYNRKSVLDGIPKDLPSLMKAYKLQAKAAKVGFDWDEIAPVWDKVEEELRELKEAAAAKNKEHTEEELGDVLFAVVNLARFLGVEGEVALHRTNQKFARRFAYIEEKVRENGAKWDELTLMELDEWWKQAKMAGL